MSPKNNIPNIPNIPNTPAPSNRIRHPPPAPVRPVRNDNIIEQNNDLDHNNQPPVRRLFF
jgi:hypothetical protein